MQINSVNFFFHVKQKKGFQPLLDLSYSLESGGSCLLVRLAVLFFLFLSLKGKKISFQNSLTCLFFNQIWLSYFHWYLVIRRSESHLLERAFRWWMCIFKIIQSVNFLWNVKTKQAVSWPGTYHINKSMFYLCVRLSCNRTIFCGSKAIISNKYTLWILIFFFPGDKDFMLTSCYHHHLVWELLTHDQQCSFPETWPSLRCCGESHRRVWEDGGRKNVCSAWGW